MELKDLSGNLGGPSRTGDSLKSRPSSKGADAESVQRAAADSFDDSGEIGQARTLIAALLSGPEVRPEVVERARTLLENGALDSPEYAERAARGIVEGDQGPIDV